MKKKAQSAGFKTQRKKNQRGRKKTKFSDVFKAFMLVGAIVAVSVIISFAVIMIHSSAKKNNNDISQTDIFPEQEKTTEPEIIQNPVTEIVSPQQPDNQNNTTPVVSNPASSSTPSSSTPSSTPLVSTPVSTTSVPPASATQNQDIRTPAQTPSQIQTGQNFNGALVFVIDDAGNNLRDLEPFLNVPGPLTIAVLPGLPYSAEAARRIRAAGKEVILHQPMESIGGQNPGPSAIYSGMGAEEIRAVLSRNIAEVGPVAGINNHQGSKITMDREIMKTILDFCAENGLYFLDSRTTADTVVPHVAAQMGFKIAERNIFIDNEQNKDSMQRYIESGLTRAQRDGSAIMIGHTSSPELAPLLSQQFPLFFNQGYTINTVSDIIRTK